MAITTVSFSYFLMPSLVLECVDLLNWQVFLQMFSIISVVTLDATVIRIFQAIDHSVNISLQFQSNNEEKSFSRNAGAVHNDVLLYLFINPSKAPIYDYWAYDTFRRKIPTMNNHLNTDRYAIWNRLFPLNDEERHCETEEDEIFQEKKCQIN